MALEELRRNIEHDAKAAAAKLEKDAQSAADKLIEDAGRSAAEAKKMAKEEAMAEVERKKAGTITTIEMEAGGILSLAREDCIDAQLKSFELAVRKRMKSKENEIIKSALKRFADIMQPSDYVIRINKKNDALLKSSKAKVEHDNIDGIIITSIDGKVTADASIDGLVGSNSELIRRTLSKGMFG